MMAHAWGAGQGGGGYPQTEVCCHGQYRRRPGNNERLGGQSGNELPLPSIGEYLEEGRMVTPGRQEVVMGTALLEKLDVRSVTG